MTFLLTILTVSALVFGLSLIRQRAANGWREALLVLFAVVYAGIMVVSEALSLVNRYHRGPIACIVAVVSVGVIVLAVKRKSARMFAGVRFAWRAWTGPLSRWERMAVYVVLTAICLKGAESVLLPPTTQDALVYHIPRYLHWFEHGNLAFYDTAIQRQNYIAPGFSQLLACADAIANGDRLFHLIQLCAFLALAAGSTLLAGECGAGVRGQVLTGILVCTTPVTLAQTTTVYCDILSAASLVAFSYFYLRNLREGRVTQSTAWAGVMAGLAVLSKTQGLLFVPILACAIGSVALLRSDWRGRKERMRVTVAVALLAGCFLVPHTMRNFSYYGRPSGCAESDTILRYPFSPPNWAYTLTCRTADVSALPIPSLNRRIGRAIGRLFPNCSANPRLHFLDTSYSHSTGSLTSATTGTFFLSLAVCLLGGVALVRNRDVWGGALMLGCFACFTAFSALIIWMPWDNRFFNGLFAIGVAVSVAACEKRWSARRGRRALAILASVLALPAIGVNAATYVPALAYASLEKFEPGSGGRRVRDAVRDGSLFRKIRTPPPGIAPELRRGYHYLLVRRERLYWGAGTASQLFLGPAYTDVVAFLESAVKDGCLPDITFFPYDSSSRFSLDLEYHYWRLARGKRPRLTFVASSRDYPAGAVAVGERARLAVCALEAVSPSTYLQGAQSVRVYTNRLFAVYRNEGPETRSAAVNGGKGK
ncbi:MAG: glycosyltransferase family 39 protein [Kiritimatiellae bacterium]|nr:glycosyltransferase family 39 protein [Kiritimatiellia bacterium]